MATLPNFALMWGYYPRGSSSSVKATIGGNVNLPWVTNTCVIRISHCFNKAGVPIPNGHAGLATAKGGNGKRYAYRVAEFKPYLERAFKAADISGQGESAFTGKQGIIMFDVEGWSDATGHFDLWNGSTCAGSAYFDKASAVYLWECS